MYSAESAIRSQCTGDHALKSRLVLAVLRTCLPLADSDCVFEFHAQGDHIRVKHMIDLPVVVRARTAPVATPVATNSKKKPKPTSAKGAKRQRVSKAATNTTTDDGVAAAVVPTDTQAKQSDVPISEVSLGTALMMFCEEACWQLKAVGMSLPTVMGDTELCGAVDTMLCNFMKVLVGKGATIMVARKTEHERLQAFVQGYCVVKGFEPPPVPAAPPAHADGAVSEEATGDALAQQQDKDGKLTYLTDASAIQLLTFLRSNPTIVSDSFQASLQPTYCSIRDATTVALTCISAPGWQCMLTKVVENVAIVLKSDWVREVEAIHSRQEGHTMCFNDLAEVVHPLVVYLIVFCIVLLFTYVQINQNIGPAIHETTRDFHHYYHG